ncbi:EF hand domain [Fusarium albosuccineum]|uniref:EF hand domain n=1 Tax=Fusarium albosuccineum TaxID=1237068 RepID=A0A8H4L9F3_9HYPO|nr:EF hand domain [Fusarium albosuccineum]
MWLPTPSVESITRPRLAVAVVSAVAAVSIGYYAYQSRPSQSFEQLPGGGLHRSNAVRRPRRNRRNEPASSSSSEAPGDENVDIDTVRPLGDGETIVEGGGDEWWNEPGGFPSNQRAGHNIVNLLFRVSEDNARRNGCVHRGCQCNACGMVPIRGVRYRCANCADFDLCETCESQGVHIKTHIFYKIRVPAPPFAPRQMQPVWYTGDPDTCRRNLPRSLIPKLSRDTGFERPELEAFWEQWTFMANSEWRDDPDELGVAMDRKTFERCLVPTGGSRHAAPNLIHDRMFSFYDSNNDDLIGFTEFLHGLSYRKRKDKLRKIFAGYDLDADGYVDRKDFLRMFRAYYVLYKQMHKDILDGLEDQLLASTEAQQLVTSRQPLSSLFGREGRVPAGDGVFRYEGKTYNQDGSVGIADGYEGVVAEDRGDTATRGDILTNLFAIETDHRSRRRFITRSDTDTNWRTVRRLSGSEADRTYWVTLLEPPSTLEELPGLLVGNHSLEIEEPTDDEDDDRDRNGHGHEGVNGIRDDEHDLGGPPRSESEIRAGVVAKNRNQAPKLDKRKRDMARKQLHERWKRRQFYLDEEEGGFAPDEWAENEDILMDLRRMDEGSSDGEATSPMTPTSSKARFANGKLDDGEGSGKSTIPSSAPEQTPRWRIPEAERDAGKEILYQVTQQAFNELLDTIFKPAEDLAVQAAETKQQREKYKDVLDTIELGDDEGQRSSTGEGGDSKVRSVADKTLEELLSETGYTIALPEGRNAVEIDTTVEIIHEDETAGPVPDSEAIFTSPDYRDPTLPQFRPDTADDAYNSPTHVWYPITQPTSTTNTLEENTDREEEPGSAPTSDMLKHWKRLSLAEAQAIRRGGWGKLSFDEFEAIYKSQEHQGNRLDYLGSWIDFCIP